MKFKTKLDETKSIKIFNLPNIWSVAICGNASCLNRDILGRTTRQNVSRFESWSQRPRKSAFSNSELEFFKCDKILSWYSTGKPRENFNRLELAPCRTNRAMHYWENTIKNYYFVLGAVSTLWIEMFKPSIWLNLYCSSKRLSGTLFDYFRKIWMNNEFKKAKCYFKCLF